MTSHHETYGQPAIQTLLVTYTVQAHNFFISAKCKIVRLKKKRFFFFRLLWTNIVINYVITSNRVHKKLKLWLCADNFLHLSLIQFTTVPALLWLIISVCIFETGLVNSEETVLYVVTLTVYSWVLIKWAYNISNNSYQILSVVPLPVHAVFCTSWKVCVQYSPKRRAILDAVHILKHFVLMHTWYQWTNKPHLTVAE